MTSTETKTRAPERQPRKNSRAENRQTVAAEDEAQSAGEQLPAESKRGPKPTPEGQPSAMQIAKGIGHYLEAVLAAGGATLGRKGVSLGALAGFPGWTTDPDVIEQAITVIREKANSSTAIVQLKYQSRILDLSAKAQALRMNTGSEDALKNFFVEHAAAYAEKHHIQYGAFRAMGVSAAVLKEAGVHP